MSDGLALRGKTGSKRIELECEHQKGVLYVVPSEANWVCKEELIHVHALAGFLNELVNLDTSAVNDVLQKWGLYYRPQRLSEKE